MDSFLRRNIAQADVAKVSFMVIHGREPTESEFTQFFLEYVSDEGEHYGDDFRILLTLLPWLDYMYGDILDMFGQDTLPGKMFAGQMWWHLGMLHTYLIMFPQVRRVLSQ